jgi:hypothetical protein
MSQVSFCVQRDYSYMMVLGLKEVSCRILILDLIVTVKNQDPTPGFEALG